MSIWHPGSGMTYEQYLQANSFVKDITGQVKVSGSNIEAQVSKQTKDIIASNEQLANVFGESFNSLSEKMEWGLSQIDYALQDVSSEVASLHSDFNYNMGLLIDEARINNKLFNDLISKLDVIHKTLESPTLTQAREYYNIGCERLSKGLLDKALEAFLESQKKNDTDFFTQFHIGKLYLYGIDDDDNVVNLEEAKKHLLLAARYAKAELSVDQNFARFAAEALLHASISVYARLGNEDVKNDVEKTSNLLLEAKKLTSDAIKICKDIPESFYHLAKYTSLLGDPESSIQNLETAIITDRNYAVKVDIDKAFDPVKPYVNKLLLRLKESKQNECQDILNQVVNKWAETTAWHPEENEVLAKEFLGMKKNLEQAKELFDSKTYFGFLDSIAILNKLNNSIPGFNKTRIEAFKKQILDLINETRNMLPKRGDYSIEVGNDSDEAMTLYIMSEKTMAGESYDSFKKALALAESAKLKAESAQKKARQEDIEEDRLRKDKIAENNLRLRRNEASKRYAGSMAMTFGIIGSLAGCVSCIQKGDFNLFGGAFLGAIIGALLGAVYGQMKE